MRKSLITRSHQQRQKNAASVVVVSSSASAAAATRNHIINSTSSASSCYKYHVMGNQPLYQVSSSTAASYSTSNSFKSKVGKLWNKWSNNNETKDSTSVAEGSNTGSVSSSSSSAAGGKQQREQQETNSFHIFEEQDHHKGKGPANVSEAEVGSYSGASGGGKSKKGDSGDSSSSSTRTAKQEPASKKSSVSMSASSDPSPVADNVKSSVAASSSIANSSTKQESKLSERATVDNNNDSDETKKTFHIFEEQDHHKGKGPASVSEAEVGSYSGKSAASSSSTTTAAKSSSPKNVTPPSESTPANKLQKETSTSSSSMPTTNKKSSSITTDSRKSFHIFEEQDHHKGKGPAQASEAEVGSYNGKKASATEKSAPSESSKPKSQPPVGSKSSLTNSFEKSTPTQVSVAHTAKENKSTSPPFHIFQEQENQKTEKPSQKKTDSATESITKNHNATTQEKPLKKDSSKATAATTAAKTQEELDIQEGKELIEDFESSHLDLSIYKKPQSLAEKMNHLMYQFSQYLKYSMYVSIALAVLYVYYKYKRYEARLKKRYADVRQNVEKRVQDRVTHFFSEEGLVGLCISIMMNKELCQEISLGFANMEHFAECKADETLMSLGSFGINDALLAYGVGRLMEDGLLKLNRVSRIQYNEQGEEIPQQVEQNPVVDASTEQDVAPVEEEGTSEEEFTSPDSESTAVAPVSTTTENAPALTVAETLRRIKESSHTSHDYYMRLYSYLSKETQIDFTSYMQEKVLSEQFGISKILPNQPSAVIPHRASFYCRDSSSGTLMNCVTQGTSPTSSVGQYLATTRDLCKLGCGLNMHPLAETTVRALDTLLFSSPSDWNALSSHVSSDSVRLHDTGSSALLISPEFHLVVASTSNSTHVNLLPLASQVAEDYSQISVVDEEYQKGTLHHLYKDFSSGVSRWFRSG